MRNELAGKQFERDMEPQVLRSLQHFPAVFVNGPRQAGKSTLAQRLIRSGGFDARYVSFDSETERVNAWSNPATYLREADTPLVIDEVQKAQKIFDAIKLTVDEIRFAALSGGTSPNGRFLLTGSANLDAVSKLAHAMVGRMVTKTLLPLSVCEAIGSKSTFLGRCFSGDFSGIAPVDLRLADAISVASFPALPSMPEDELRGWFDAYIRRAAYEDPVFLYKLEKAECLPFMLKSIAIRAGSLLNDAGLGRELGLNAVTTKTYRRLLEQMFLTNSLAPWRRNVGRRLVKSKKAYFHDTMLLCHLLETSPSSLAACDPNRFGHVLENFVLTELTKASHAASEGVGMSYYRTSAGAEVDFVLERGGKMVAIEVKHAENVSKRDIKGVFDLRDAMGKDLLRSIVLCNAPRVLSFDKDILLVPFAALWQ